MINLEFSDTFSENGNKIVSVKTQYIPAFPNVFLNIPLNYINHIRKKIQKLQRIILFIYLNLLLHLKQSTEEKVQLVLNCLESNVFKYKL